MLQSLHIQNYALISNLEIDFSSGFSTITGETGAGKSILMGALALILGQRADTGSLKDKSKKCIIEGSFDIKNYSLQDLFHDYELDYDNTALFRREISIDGKSRAFINDTPVNIGVLKEIGSRLVDIHSQHQNLILGDDNFQLQVVDTYAGNNDLLLKYKVSFSGYKKLLSELISLNEKAAKSKTDLDYFQFQFDQLHDAKITVNEQEDLEQELAILTHSGEISLNLEKSVFLLKDKEENIISQLKETQTAVRIISKYRTDAIELVERLESCIIELKDIAGETEKMASGIDNNPARMDAINLRLDLIYSLLQKHHVKTCNELNDIKTNLENRLNEIASYDTEIENLEKKIAVQFAELKSIAQNLHKKREKVSSKFETDIINLLKQLGMPNVTFNVVISEFPEPQSTGFDKILFTFSANKNIAAEEISKVASGGEISRLMLSIKSVISGFTHLPTIIFDEIDTGVSGEIADKMGNIMRSMANNMQVFSITHLPQIASKGNQHYIVFKTENKETTTTQIKQLNNEERIREIARMLSGSELTEAAINNAKELINAGKS